MKNKNLIFLVAASLLIGAYIIFKILYQQQETTKLQDLSQKNNSALVREYSAKLGPDNAKVQLVEFLDPECESCRMFYPLVKDLLKKYPNTQLVIRYMPLHPNSQMAIKILEASRKQQKYWETMEVLFKHQPEWGDHHNPRPEMVWQYLPEAQVDVEKIKQDMNDPDFERIIQTDYEDGKSLGVRATPGFFVNGQPLVEFGIEQLEKMIADAHNK